MGSTKKSASLLCLNQILGAADWNLHSDMGSHKRWYTNQDLILHSGIPYTLPFAHVLNHDLESSISCMLMQTLFCRTLFSKCYYELYKQFFLLTTNKNKILNWVVWIYLSPQSYNFCFIKDGFGWFFSTRRELWVRWLKVETNLNLEIATVCSI